MRTKILWIAFVAACTAVFATALAAQSADVTGRWTFDVQTSGGGGMPTVTFKQDGEKISGHYSSQTFGEADFTGTLKGNVIHFAFNGTTQGQAVDVVYDGTVDKGTMKGTIAIAGGQVSGTFTAKKQ